jgi:lipopolysaccharide transport system ATP-binding protein
MAPVIKVDGLGKRYWVAHRQRESYSALRDVLASGVKDLFTRSNKNEVRNEPFWALKDVHFEVEQGEVLGVIGPNGAGKSTLLKILSRITEPTTGRVTLHGRVASLLEVGTGFHPELTGRENIYLSGAILGMNRREIRRQFDEIVDFSGVEAFLDTPVKRYSSGMRVRLGFAVAAHLQPEILLIDEVLAVGDAAFQTKCLGKMNEVAKDGRTVLFVSHNLQAVERICNRGLLLEKGKIIALNTPSNVISQYVRHYSDSATWHYYLNEEYYEKNNRWVRVKKITFSEDKLLKIILNTQRKMSGLALVCTIQSIDHVILFKSSTAPIWSTATFDLEEDVTFELDLSNLHLIHGEYLIGIEITIPNVKSLLKITRALKIVFPETIQYQGNKKLTPGKDGYLKIDHSWKRI